MKTGRRAISTNMIAESKQALERCFDFEPVMEKDGAGRAHFGYMATGVDDEMTMRANRETVFGNSR